MKHREEFIQLRGTRTYNVHARNFYNRLGFSVSVDVPSAICEYYSSDRVYMERAVSSGF